MNILHLYAKLVKADSNTEARITSPLEVGIFVTHKLDVLINTAKILGLELNLTKLGGLFVVKYNMTVCGTVQQLRSFVEIWYGISH